MSGQNPSPGFPWQRHLHNKSYSSSHLHLGGPLIQPPTVRHNSKSVSSVASETSFRRPHAGSPTRSTASTSTFAPSFIRTVDQAPFGRRRSGTLDSKYGSSSDENASPIGGQDFSGRRYVWVKDPNLAFIKAEVIEDDNGMLTIRCEDGSERIVHVDNVDKVNPAKFDKADDMAELTHLNEASVVHNLHMRYMADLIYTYSGLFLVTVNPYCNLPIYGNDYIEMYKNCSREDTKPHIFAVTDLAFRNMLENRENQSILVTGESGAGKTENTKKVIQYLAAVAADSSSTKQLGTLEQQILRANPILEAFGNAQTVRNNNSSRFGKFIRIEFSRSGQIAGAFIDWYLLEKSRVVKQNSEERNYHIFYQLLRGASRTMKEAFLIGDRGIEDFNYTKSSNKSIAGVNDIDEFRHLLDAFSIMGFSEEEQLDILRVVAAVLHIGNLEIVSERRGEEARLVDKSQAERLCHVLSIPIEPFVKGLLKPRVKAGREWVNQSRTAEQVRHSLDALGKGLYERGFGRLVDLVNNRLESRGGIGTGGRDVDSFIGVLDIAGFEIFQSNSFEQLCINYTNEKLQQFFNHHMFVLEQEEYARERIEWKFIDFGHDLQPTIDLIELPNPIGIFSCLDEDCVMPKATDKSFTEKLHSLWDKKSPKYRRSLLNQGFILTHYAAEVEYNTEDWLEKNKDPLNDNITKLLASSHDKYIANLFSDYADDSYDSSHATKSRVKKGLFRTVAQRHKEQLSSLMTQLNSTHPHFVRCIIPNHQKRPKRLNNMLVLDQLRCNGVLEGIRIARTGFPNRLPFSEFRQRYEVLTPKMPKGYLEGQKACQMMLQELDLDTTLYRVGLTKVFFRAGVLAELEEQRDKLVREIMTKFQSLARGYLQRKLAKKRLYRAEATKVIHRNMRVYLRMCESPWWRLFMRMKPLLGATASASEVRKRDEMINKLEEKMQMEAVERQRLDEERRRADQELSRVQKILESERALALDKEEIFKRLQAREADLEDKLAGALEDQEELEEQIDELIAAKRKVEEQAEAWRNELEQGAELIGRLEEEKKELKNRLEEIEKELEEKDKEQTRRNDQTENLEKEISLLKSHLALKERKLADCERQLAQSDKNLEEKLVQATHNLEASQKQLREMIAENRQIRSQLAELSATSTNYEDLVRRKESEVSLLRADLKKNELDRKIYDDEKAQLLAKQDEVLSRLRVLQSEMETLRRQKLEAEQEAEETRKLLDAKIAEDTKFGQGKKLLDEQIKNLKAQLQEVQLELSRERQSRADVVLLSDHKYSNLKRDHDAMTTAKVTIEKELYTQQDTLRRALEARSQAEKEKRALQTELNSLRQRYEDSQHARLQAESEMERSISRQAKEKEATMKKELMKVEEELNKKADECVKLNTEVNRFLRVVSEQDSARQSYEASRKRIESELSTIKGRLTASEHDNRSLQNKIQQKNLEISKANQKAAEQYRTKIVSLTAEKQKTEEEQKKLQKQLNDAQLQISSLEKQKEKLSLNLEDLNHEVSREHKHSRNAEKLTSTLQIQIAELNRNLETERQMKSQAQANTRRLQGLLEAANSELNETRQQLLVMQKVFDPEIEVPTTWEAGARQVHKNIDLASKLDDANQALRVANEKLARAEQQLVELRRRHKDEIDEIDNMHATSKRAILDEFGHPNIPSNGSPRSFLKDLQAQRQPPFATPNRRIWSSATADTVDSTRTDKTLDTVTFQKRMDLASELELVQNQLQMAEMQNRHLQNQLDRANLREATADDSPSVRRVQRLERENNRLQDMLDDTTEKVSALESLLRSGELSVRDIQAKSHEELFELLNSQEQARRQLLTVHNITIADLTDAKAQAEKAKAAKIALEVELRDKKSELEEALEALEQDQASRNQLLQEFGDLQIRFDAEISRAADLTASLNLYKGRSEEYFSKLEQAEIAVLKSTRAEAFAKAQCKEAEDTCATVLAERRATEALVEDLQRQNQKLEEKLEDLAADFNAAIQSKKRLQDELEDYRNRRTIDLEDKEASMEQTRKKYQNELAILTGELEIERENIVQVRTENRRLREEVESLRAKWDDEVLNSSTWAKEKSRLEIKLADVQRSYDEAVAAHNDSQAKVVSLLSQVQNLRTQNETLSAANEAFQKEKKTLEKRLQDVTQSLEDLAKGDSPAMRNAAGIDKEILDLKTSLSQQQDVAQAAMEKMRRAEALTAEIQRDIANERENNVALHKDKAALEKQVKDLQLKLVDLETKSYTTSSGDVRFLHTRVQELEKQIEEEEKARSKSERSIRNVDRTVRDLQAQIERRDKANTQLEEEIAKGKEKISNLLGTIEELQASDSASQLAARRAEREAREEREKSLRLERELEGWKGLRLDRSHVSKSNTSNTMNVLGRASLGGADDINGKTFL